MGVKFMVKKRYVTLEWPHMQKCIIYDNTKNILKLSYSSNKLQKTPYINFMIVYALVFVERLICF